jgi:hypothetical protein
MGENITLPLRVRQGSTKPSGPGLSFMHSENKTLRQHLKGQALGFRVQKYVRPVFPECSVRSDDEYRADGSAYLDYTLRNRLED